MKVEDVYLLVLHEPYESAEHPVSIDATIVHALTLLHPLVPQPDGGRLPQVADWQAVTDAVVRLSRTGCATRSRWACRPSRRRC